MNNMNDEKSAAIVTTASHPSDSSAFDHVQTVVTRPTGWPTDAEPLVQWSKKQWHLIIYDIVLTLTPLALIAKTILIVVAARIDRDSTGESFDEVHPLTINLVQFNSQLTTLFTIVFATIVSTLVRRVALWRAQQSATVAELEQWQASTSLTGTIKTIWSLRMFTATSLGLVAVWSWYYLGSQASIREYTYQVSGHTSHLNVTFTNTRGPSALDGTLKRSQIAANNARFMIAFAEDSDTASGYDQNGFLLLPRIDQTASNDIDSHGFSELIPASLTRYASRVGLATYAVFPEFDYIWTYKLIGDLTVNTSYLGVECAPAQIRDISDFPSGVLQSFSVSINMTASSNNSSNGPASFDVWYRALNTTAQIQALSSTCNITTVPFQIKATCSSQGCVAKQLRPVDIDLPDRHKTVFKNATFATIFFDELLQSTGLPSDRTDKTIVEGRVGLPGTMEDTLLNATGSRHVTDIDILTQLLPANLPAVAAANRLSISTTQDHLRTQLNSLAEDRSLNYLTPIINTYLGLFQQSQTLGTIQDQYPQNHGESVFRGAISSPWVSVGQLDGGYWNPQYKLSLPWLIVDVMACSVLLLAGMIAVYLRSQILAPDVFGYVSSMTRDNPNIHLSQPASTLDGMARARLLKNVKVQLADVEWNREIGRVGLVQVTGDGRAHASNLSKEKQYL